MRFGYNLQDPQERKMYFEHFRRNLERANNKELTLQEGFNEVRKEHQEMMEYFIERDKREKELQKDIEKQIEQQIEQQVNTKLDKVLKELFK